MKCLGYRMIFGMGVSMMRPLEMDANDAVKVGASARHFPNNLGIMSSEEVYS